MFPKQAYLREGCFNCYHCVKDKHFLTFPCSCRQRRDAHTQFHRLLHEEASQHHPVEPTGEPAPDQHRQGRGQPPRQVAAHHSILDFNVNMIHVCDNAAL